MAESTKNVRADAQRNRAQILDTAVAALASDPMASVAEIARAAGVGRVTLYGHFASRDELLHAVALHVMRQVETELGSVPLDGDPLTALERLASTSWKLIDRFQGVVSAMARGTEAGRSREDHDHVLDAVRGLIARGQATGDIRTDQSVDWLTSCLYSVLHNAGAEVRAGRIGEADVERFLPGTVRALMTP